MADHLHNGLSEFGIAGAKILIGGFFGGVLQAFLLRKASPWMVVTNILAGLLTANYFGAIAAYTMRAVPGWEHVAGFDPDAAGGFVVGITAMLIIGGITGMVKRKLKVEGNGPKPT